jgi:hypothetical protein
MSAADETDAEFLARLERIGRDWRYSDEFIGLIVRNRFPREWPGPGRDADRPAAVPAVSAEHNPAGRGHGDRV